MPEPISQSSAQTLAPSTPNFTVVGFYTKDTPYEQEIQGLERTCKEHGIPCITRGYRNREKWVRNAAIKPEFLLEMLELGKTIVYADADARIRKYPKLFDTLDADIAVHYRTKRGRAQPELLSGTIFLASNERTKKLVAAWLVAQQEDPDIWDQRVLDRVLKDWREPLKLAELPATYCQIFDSMKDAGSPVIEHLQASRRFKKLVERHVSGVTACIPDMIYGTRIRQHVGDGSYWIARPHRKVEAYLDTHCVRIGRSLRWVPKFVTDNRIEDLRSMFVGKLCYIVGKGPSLDHLTSGHFSRPDAPILALNEAIYAVEELNLPNPLFGLQQDASLRARCKPARSPIFVSTKAANYYVDCEQAYIFQNSSLGLSPNALSVSAAVTISRLLGSAKFEMLCFDACVNKKLTYAERVGYKSTWGGKPERFLSHRTKIIKHAQSTPVAWTIPEAPA